jgi:hypothetical protein
MVGFLKQHGASRVSMANCVFFSSFNRSSFPGKATTATRSYEGSTGPVLELHRSTYPVVSTISVSETLGVAGNDVEREMVFNWDVM